VEYSDTVLIDKVDAPSRSKHYARAATNYHVETENDDASFTNMMEETVAIKILNPVGFRALSTEVTNSAVVVRSGDPLHEGDIMEERHVWWLVHPNSRNLRTLQRSPIRVEIDRGSPEKGLRISLIAAYQSRTGELKELPLTRCIEIWGHVPFGASDAEFKNIMQAIDRINQGLPPPTSLDAVPGRVGTGQTGSTTTGSLEESTEELKQSNPITYKRT
jgi:hypothetical protein